MKTWLKGGLIGLVLSTIIAFVFILKEIIKYGIGRLLGNLIFMGVGMIIGIGQGILLGILLGVVFSIFVERLWKDRSHTYKGGVITLVVCSIILGIFGIFLWLYCIFHSCSLNAIGLWFFVPFWVIMMFPEFGIGAIIGLIVGKIKNRTQNTQNQLIISQQDYPA